uniref:Uncharacterized protein n=1 Tax=Anguilla anguilla TaxID=7936 RepID=A0A0E9QZW0_ANGAN
MKKSDLVLFVQWDIEYFSFHFFLYISPSV